MFVKARSFKINITTGGTGWYRVLKYPYWAKGYCGEISIVNNYAYQTPKVYNLVVLMSHNYGTGRLIMKQSYFTTDDINNYLRFRLVRDGSYYYIDIYFSNPNYDGNIGEDWYVLRTINITASNMSSNFTFSDSPEFYSKNDNLNTGEQQMGPIVDGRVRQNKTDYYEFYKSEIPNYTSLTDAEALEYFIDNNISYDQTKTVVVQMRGSSDYSALVQVIAGNAQVKSAIVSSYNNFFKIIRNNNGWDSVQSLHYTSIVYKDTNSQGLEFIFTLNNRTTFYVYTYGVNASHDVNYNIIAHYTNNSLNLRGIFLIDKSGAIYNYGNQTSLNLTCESRIIESSAGFGWYGREMKITANSQFMHYILFTNFTSFYSFDQLYI